jgi:hypothetical protein
MITGLDFFASAFAANASIGVRNPDSDAEARRAAFMHGVSPVTLKAKRGRSQTSSPTPPPSAFETRPIAPAHPARSAGQPADQIRRRSMKS